jgi:hypothetical protein
VISNLDSFGDRTSGQICEFGRVVANEVPDRSNDDKLLHLQQIPSEWTGVQRTRLLSIVWLWADQKPRATNLDGERNRSRAQR